MLINTLVKKWVSQSFEVNDLDSKKEKETQRIEGKEERTKYLLC